MANLQCGAILIQVHVFFLQNPLIIGSMLHAECVFFVLCSLTLISSVLVGLAGCRMGPVDKIHIICKMRLAGLHDLYDSWHLHIRRFLFGLSTLLWILTSSIIVNYGWLSCRMSDVDFLQVG